MIFRSEIFTMNNQENNVELQFELKKLEFTPYSKQGDVCLELVQSLRIASPAESLEILNRLKKENDLFFDLILADF